MRGNSDQCLSTTMTRSGEISIRMAVISTVLSRPSTSSRSPRSSANFRLWREGTDPASRGLRAGGWASGHARGGTA